MTRECTRPYLCLDKLERTSCGSYTGYTLCANVPLVALMVDKTRLVGDADARINAQPSCKQRHHNDISVVGGH